MDGLGKAGQWTAQSPGEGPHQIKRCIPSLWITVLACRLFPCSGVAGRPRWLTTCSPRRGGPKRAPQHTCTPALPARLLLSNASRRGWHQNSLLSFPPSHDYGLLSTTIIRSFHCRDSARILIHPNPSLHHSPLPTHATTNCSTRPPTSLESYHLPPPEPSREILTPWRRLSTSANRRATNVRFRI